MKVLVTGAAGFVGSALVRRLLQEGHEVVGVDNFSATLYSAASKRARLDRLDAWSTWTFHELDIASTGLSYLLDGVQVVINEAAVPGLAPSWVAFDAYAHANLIGVQKILRDLVERPGVHLVQASTSSVYGSVAQGNEDGTTSPVSPYGVTKLAAENLIRIYRESFGVSASILRYFSVYGPHQRPDMAYSLFCQAMISGHALCVTGDGSQRRSNTYIDDVVDATVRAADAQIDGLVANVSGGSSISVLQAIDILADELGAEPIIRFEGGRPGDQRETCGDAGRAARELGWIAQTPINLGLRQQAQAALTAWNGGRHRD